MVHDPLEGAGREAAVLGAILVGGASRRYGHDKAMARLDAIPMVQHVAARVAGQVSMLAASGAGRPGLDLAVIPDAVPHGGPLPALLSILAWAREHEFELVATFSCDTPFLPSDLVMRLRRVLEPDRDCAVALHGGAAHPTCALWKVSALPKIQAAFDSGVRSLHGALAHLATCAADFSDSDAGPGGDPFFNINSPFDMAQAQAWSDRPVESARATDRMTRGKKMVDPFGRVVDYLRVSVTDRCNLRCTYCMSEDMRFLPKADLLSLEEIDRLCTLFIERGVAHLRLTGGEPLMRRGILKLVNNLSRHLDSGALQELTLTTNGVRLREFAAGLAAAGVRRINVSLDSLDRTNFARIARGDRLPQVLDGIAAAQDAGLKVKINTVALKRDNAAELPRLVQWAHAGDMDITLIETMPLGEVEADRTDQFLSLAEVRRDMESYWTLTELPERTGGPARYVQVAETGGRLGFITPLTHNFCDTCRRMRVTCTGTLFMCLGQEAAVDLRAPLRGGAGDGAVHEAIDRAVAAKPKSHDFLLPVRGAAPALGRHMSMTGG